MKRWIHSGKSTRDRITYLENRISELESFLEDSKMSGADMDDLADTYAEIDRLKDELNFAWQDDEAEYDYAVEQQEFNPDGSLKYY